VTRGDAVLAAGYVVSVPVLLRFRTLVKERNALMYFGVLEVGQILVTAGWAMKGKRLRALVNGAAAVAYPAYWVLSA
jgi:hypothetical protein